MGLKKLQMDAVSPIETETEITDDKDEIAEIFSDTNDHSQTESKLGNEQQEDSVPSSSYEIPIDRIKPSKHNKFIQYEGTKKAAMVDSIRENGIITPLTLRKEKNSDMYEIISGENRWRCAKEIGLMSVPANVVECDEESAIMMLTEANLINRDITFRERITAYRQQYDVMKKKSGERNDLTETGEKVDSLDILAKKYNESRTQMYRYVRLAELADGLIEKTGTGQVALDAAVKLIGLNKDGQTIVDNYLNDTSVKIKMRHAEEILKSYNTDCLNFTSLDDIFESESTAKKPVKSIKMKRFSRFFENESDVNTIEDTIEKALQMYFEQQASETDEDEYTQCDEIE